MVISSQMVGDRLKQFNREMEKQGAKTRRTKKGLMVYAPDGATITVHTTYGDRRAIANDIAWFRRHGLVHPSDTTKESKVVRKAAETTEDGYPLYMVGAINGTTRKRVLAELESRGWPLRVKATELEMDTVTATRALYNVGYRWDLSTSTRHRVWVAPDDIKEMHEKVKAEMARRETEARQEREFQKELQATCKHESWEAHGAVRKCADCGKVLDPLPPKEATPGLSVAFMENAHRIKPSVTMPPLPSPPPSDRPLQVIENVVSGLIGKKPERQEDYAITPPGLSEPKSEREFIDDADSWVVEGPVPAKVERYLSTLRSAGLEVEIRVWRKK